jgi:hypothetical protein
MICTIRIPDVLRARIDSAAGDGKRSEWILEACRMRLDGPIVGKVPSQALREICAGKRDEGRTDPMNDVKARPNEAAVPSDPKPCVECTNPMREVKGKWACADASCAMYGKEQKGKQ